MSGAPRHVPAGSGPRYDVIGGDQMTIKATGADNGGAFVAIETVVPPHAGPPRHIHHLETETFYVLEGDFEFFLDDDVIKAGAGDFLFAPKDIPHHFRNSGDTPGKLLIVCHPAGFEHFVEEFAALPPDEHPDPVEMAAIGAKHGIEFVPPA